MSALSAAERPWRGLLVTLSVHSPALSWGRCLGRVCAAAMALKPQEASESPRDLVETQIAGSFQEVWGGAREVLPSSQVVLVWLGPGPHLENHRGGASAWPSQLTR